MPILHGPAVGFSQLHDQVPPRRRGRVAAIAVSLALALALVVLGAFAGSAVAQTGGSPSPDGSATTAQAPSSGGSGWTVVQKATWYGPGLWGRSTACGIILTPRTIGVANKNLPCGTAVTFSYGGRSVAATVIDRGPYNKGYAWDLTKKVAKRLGFLAVGAGPVTATVTLPAP